MPDRMSKEVADIMAGSDIQATVAQHNAEIAALGGRMSGVETGLRTLQSEVHTGFAGINVIMHKLDTKIDRFDQRPQVNWHQSIQTGYYLAVLFGLVVGGIIYVSTAQFGAAFQKITDNIENIEMRSAWTPNIKKAER